MSQSPRFFLLFKILAGIAEEAANIKKRQLKQAAVFNMR